MNIFLIAAQSVDGFIARSPQEPSTAWTSAEDSQFFRQTTQAAQVVIYGSSTFRTIPEKYRPLKNRLNIVYSKNPASISPKTIADLTPASASQSTDLIATNLPPDKVIAELASKGYHSVAICGGQSIYNLFLSARLVNKIYLTIEPVVFGSGLKLFDKPLAKPLQLDQIIRLNNHTIVLEYSVV